MSESGYKIFRFMKRMSDAHPMGYDWAEIIFSWDDARLESTHDYIQWLFPTGRESSFSSTAPVLSKKDIRELSKIPFVINCQELSARRMLRFYQNTHYWRSGVRDHNHLRITRIIDSLVTLGSLDEASRFFDSIMLLTIPIEYAVPRSVVEYWEHALLNNR